MMKKILTFTTVSLFFNFFAQSQHNHSYCGNDVHKMKKEIPGLDDAIDKYYQAFIDYQSALPQGELREDGVRIIPTVVHIIHEGGTENISKARVQEMIDILNDDFAKRTDVFRIPPRFDSIAVDSKIEFRLAQKDPQGNCTDGIIRIYSYKTNDARDVTRFKGLSSWNRNEYLNIWIVRSIDSGGEQGIVLGYAQFPFLIPGLATRASTDGITLISSVVGNAAGSNKFVTAHEVGHWLGLFHTWGDAVCGDDQVEDTPIQRGPNFGWWCGDPNEIKQATCYENFLTVSQDSIMRFLIGENYQNYMDYGDCKVMFTRGQLERMNFTLNNIPFRASLHTEANLIKTGVNDGFTCEKMPIPDFWTNTMTTCVGDNVTFTNGTFNGTADSFEWELPGATPSTSTQVNPTVTYSQPGIYNVTLKAIKDGQTFTKERTRVIYVMPSQPLSKPWGYFEGFEDGNLITSDNWFNINPDNNSNRWEITADASFTGVASLRMKNENNTTREIDRLITPPFDMAAIPSAGASKVLEFKYSYARKTGQSFAFNPASGTVERVANDELRIFFSTNCGRNWFERSVLTGNALVTAGLVESGFVPQSKDQWRTLRLTIPGAFANSSNFQVMFEWRAGSSFGNDFYLDDFRIWDENSTGIAENVEDLIGLNVYPNPSNDFVKIDFNLNESISKADIILTDMAGRMVTTIYSGALNQGEHTYVINKSQVRNSGLYFLRINLGGREIVKKVMFQ